MYIKRESHGTFGACMKECKANAIKRRSENLLFYFIYSISIRVWKWSYSNALGIT